MVRDLILNNGIALLDVDEPWGFGLVSSDEPWGLGDGMVQMLADLSDFGELGMAESRAYGDYHDARESYPLGADVYSEGDYAAGVYYDDEGVALEPDNSDIRDPETPDEAELAKILMERRQAIADAIKQRELQTQKVDALDREIVEVLNPQYQAALAAGNRDEAVAIGGKIRALNLERAAAVQKAIDWAKFQTTASQLAKNVRAQLALMQLYYATKRQDPQQAAAIARAYQEIGQATSAIKAARKAAEKRQERASATLKLADAQKLLQQKQRRVELLTKQIYGMLRGKDESRLAPAAAEKLAALRAQLDTAQAELVDAQGAYQEAQAASRAAASLQGLDDVVPYCALYTRDGYGPTCLRRRELNLGDIEDVGDLAWGEPAQAVLADELQRLDGLAAELGSWWDTAAELTAGTARAVATEVGRSKAERKARELCEIDCRASGAKPAEVAACLARCKAGASSGVLLKPEAKPIIVLDPWYTRMGVVLPLALLAAGVAGGVYYVTRKPRGSAVQGLGGVRRRRRHRR